MTKDEIIKLAREAGIDPSQDTLCRHGGWEDPIEAFALAAYEAGRTAAREECAKVCDTTPPYPFRPSIEAAHAIRERGKP